MTEKKKAVKSSPIPIRLTEHMRKRVETSAEKSQENLTEWIRKAIEMRLKKEN